MTNSNPPVAPPDQPDKKDPSKEGSNPRTSLTDDSSVPDTIEQILETVIQAGVSLGSSPDFTDDEENYLKKYNYTIKQAKAALAAHIRGATGQLADDTTLAAQGHEADNLYDFAEFCHSYYTGCSRAFPGAKWEYGYDHEVVTMVELYLSQKHIVATVVTGLAKPDPGDNTNLSNPQEGGALQKGEANETSTTDI